MKSQRLKDTLMGLLNFGARFNVLDSDGRDAMFYAIEANNEDLADFLLKNGETAKLDKGLKDVAAKSHMHVLVQPREYGSFENKKLMEKLFKNGYSLKLTDSQGRHPIDYARMQKSGVLAMCIGRLLNDSTLAEGIEREMTGIPENMWPDRVINFEADHALFMN